MTINNQPVRLRVNPQGATKKIEEATARAGNKIFTRGRRNYWHQEGNQGVREQNLYWLYVWACHRQRASCEAKEAFNHIFDMDFDSFPGGFIHEARKQRYRDNGSVIPF